MTSSRGTHVTRDIIPADSRQILMVLTAKNVRPLPCMQFCFFCPTAACLCCPPLLPPSPRVTHPALQVYTGWTWQMSFNYSVGNMEETHEPWTDVKVRAHGGGAFYLP